MPRPSIRLANLVHVPGPRIWNVCSAQQDARHTATKEGSISQTVFKLSLLPFQDQSDAEGILTSTRSARIAIGPIQFIDLGLFQLFMAHGWTREVHNKCSIALCFRTAPKKQVALNMLRRKPKPQVCSKNHPVEGRANGITAL